MFKSHPTYECNADRKEWHQFIDATEYVISLLQVKRFLWCLSLMILMISEVRCGAKCGVFWGPVPC